MKCRHLVVDEAVTADFAPGPAPLDPMRSQITRRCLLCGVSYDRSAELLRLRMAMRERYRLPTSPWTGAERAADPW